MMNSKYRATGLIQEAFEKKHAKYNVEIVENTESVCVPFAIDEGPGVMARFISRDNDNDVAFRIFGLINDIKVEKRNRVSEACNILNDKVRYLKFIIDDDGDVNVEYDFPQHISDDCVGEVAFEMLRRAMVILDSNYSIFMKAMYTSEELNADEKNSASKLLEMLHSRVKRAVEKSEDDEVSERRREILRRLEELRNKMSDSANYTDNSLEDDPDDEE